MKNLRRLAAAHGALVDYHGLDGLSRANPDALLAVLALLGAPVENMSDVEGALAERSRSMRGRFLEPVQVVWDDGPPSISLGTSEVFGRLDVALELEDGSATRYSVDVGELAELRSRGGRKYRCLTLAERPPLGYHRLSLRAGAVSGQCLLVSAPRRAFRRDGGLRRWGLFAPLYGVTTRDSWGAGDFSDLAQLVELGSDFVQTLPLLATFLDDPSPYSPVSRFFWNELFVDPRRAPEFAGSEPNVLSHEGGTLVDYREIDRRKRPLLEGMSKRARAERPDRLLEFCEQSSEVSSYARFRAEREDGRVRPERRPFDLRDDRVLYHVYAQMIAEEQLAWVGRKAREAGVQLYFDHPLGVNRFGFDTLSRKSLFAHRADVGAPPDAAFPDGQNWGFPPLLPEESREEGYVYVRRSLEQAMRHADLLRVDHVMGLHRQFWIPQGFEKRDGIYVRYPAEELYAVFNLESHRNQCELVGENLGIVPQSVGDALARHEWRGIYILQFSLTGRTEEPIRPVPGNVVASFGTHDTPTFAGFCRARDVDERVEAGLLDPERAGEIRRHRRAAIAVADRLLGVSPAEPELRLRRWIDFLIGSEAELLALGLEDLWLEDAPQNVPGRIDLPNWRRKLRYSIDRLPDDVLSLLDEISRRFPRPRNTR